MREDSKTRTPEGRAERLKNWALILGSIAAVVASSTSLFSSLGIDKLIARKHTAQTETARKSYETLAASNAKLRRALRIVFERIRSLESQVVDLKENQRLSMWAKLAAVSGPPPPAPDPVPMRTSDPAALLGPKAPGWSLSTILGKTKHEGLDLLEDSEPPEWDQVQRQEP